jgi:hypothetical protein
LYKVFLNIYKIGGVIVVTPPYIFGALIRNLFRTQIFSHKK